MRSDRHRECMVDRTQFGEPGDVVIEDERDLDALSRWAKTTKDASVPIWCSSVIQGTDLTRLRFATPR